jgi:tRNA A-37 threonylcarbamoyl transferase component Bud32
MASTTHVPRPHGRPSPDRTREMRLGQADPDTDTTDFTLSASAVAPASGPRPNPGRRPAKTRQDRLDDATRRQFHARLRLCCLIATVPLGFFFVSSVTNFIDLFGYAAVGPAGTVLCGVVLVALAALGVWMFRTPPLPERWLRVLEVAVFGQLALFFAYWQFAVQTAVPAYLYQAVAERTDPVRDLLLRTEQNRVLAAALVVHFNWLLLIVFHAVLVPNTVARGIGVTVAMILTPLVIDGVVAATSLPAQQNPVALFAVALTMLAAGGGLAVFGTAKTAELQRQVASAREAVREMGQYRLRRKLGSGGMGEVYLAEHRLLKRPCALKRIHARYLHSPEQVRRFQLEVQATAQLRHPNTVEIYDYGVADDGTFYYVMEYLPGMSLEDLVGRFGPLPPERAVYLLRQVCGALREAHEHGLVHRDIKPSNVVVFAAGSPHDRVKLVDFGLVHTLSEEQPEGKITRDGLIVGTPEYMSPEQASGGVLDGRSDLFSLGSVAYYLLTGREAFHRENPMKTLMAVVSDTPTPVVDFNPLVPDDLLAVVARCLHKDVTQRFQSAADLDHALADCRFTTDWTEARAEEWWARNANSLPGTGTDLSTLPLRDSDGGE